MLLYTFFVVSFDWYKEYTICPISLNRLSELLPAFTCARAVGNLWSVCFGVNILSPVPCFVLYLALDLIFEKSLNKLTIFCLDL